MGLGAGVGNEDDRRMLGSSLGWYDRGIGNRSKYKDCVSPISAKGSVSSLRNPGFGISTVGASCNMLWCTTCPWVPSHGGWGGWGDGMRQQEIPRPLHHPAQMYRLYPDDLFIIKQVLGVLVGQVPVTLRTDCASLWDHIYLRKQATEKRLLVELALIRDCLEKKEISNIEWIESNRQPTTAF